MSSTLGQIRGPMTDGQGNLTPAWARYFAHLEAKIGLSFDLQGIATPAALDLTRAYTNKNQDNIPDGATNGQVRLVALTAGQVDLTKSGVLGPLGSTKAAPGIQLNSTNLAKVDSIDAGSSATVRIYGAAGGAGTSWTRKVGSVTEGPFASGNLTGLLYNTQYNVMWDGVQFYAFTDLPSTLPDNLKYVGTLTTLPSSGGTTATATAILTGTAVSSVNVTNAGSGYTSAPTVTFNGGGGTGAAGYATISGGGVISVTMTNSGTGYTSVPTVAFAGGQAGTTGGGGTLGTGKGARYNIQ